MHRSGLSRKSFSPHVGDYQQSYDGSVLLSLERWSARSGQSSASSVHEQMNIVLLSRLKIGQADREDRVVCYLIRPAWPERTRFQGHLDRTSRVLGSCYCCVALSAGMCFAISVQITI